MKTQGIKILFKSRAPTREELQECLYIHLTSKKEWNPHKVRMSEVMVSLVSANRPNDVDEDLPTDPFHQQEGMESNQGPDERGYGIGNQIKLFECGSTGID